MHGVLLNNLTSLFFELGCFHRVQYKFSPAPAVEHLLLIPVKADCCSGAGCGALGVMEDEGTGVSGRHG